MFETKSYLFGIALLTVFGATSVRAAEQAETIPDTVRDQVSRLVENYQSAAAEALSVALNAPEGRYLAGDNFALEVLASTSGRYLYVDYYQLDGNVVHILPSAGLPQHRVAAGSALAIGMDEEGPRFTVLPPFGRELLVVTATSQPLFPELRREFEDALQYLEALEPQLMKLSADEGQIAISLHPISTAETPAGFGEVALLEAEPDQPPDIREAEIEPAPPQVQMANLPLDEAAQNAPVAEGAASQPEAAAPTPREFYLRRIAPRLQRLVEAPGDSKNLALLSEAYADYVVRLALSGDLGEAHNQLEIARLFDPLSKDLELAWARLQRVQQAKDAYDSALLHLNLDELEVAHDAIAESLRLEPDLDLAQDKLAELTPRFRAFYETRAQSADSAQDLQQSLYYWRRVSQLEPENDAVLQEIRRLESLLGTAAVE